ATTEISPLSLHDALPISVDRRNHGRIERERVAEGFGDTVPARDARVHAAAARHDGFYGDDEPDHAVLEQSRGVARGGLRRYRVGHDAAASFPRASADAGDVVGGQS